MLPIFFTILFCVIDVVVCLCLLVLLMASMANGSPSQLAQIKAIMWLVAAFALGIPAAIVAMCLGKHPAAMLLSIVPVLGCLIAFTIAWDVSKYQVSPELMPSIGRLIARVLVLIVFGGGGLAMFYVGAREWIFQRTVMSDSTTVPAQIIHSEVKTTKSHNTKHGTLRDDSTTTHDPEVRFRYELDGHAYESDLLRPSAIVRTYASKESAMDGLAAFPVGATVQVYVNRAMPDKAFLVRESSAGPIVFLILGFLLTPIALLATRLV